MSWGKKQPYRGNMSVSSDSEHRLNNKQIDRLLTLSCQAENVLDDIIVVFRNYLQEAPPPLDSQLQPPESLVSIFVSSDEVDTVSIPDKDLRIPLQHARRSTTKMHVKNKTRSNILARLSKKFGKKIAVQNEQQKLPSQQIKTRNVTASTLQHEEAHSKTPCRGYQDKSNTISGTPAQVEGHKSAEISQLPLGRASTSSILNESLRKHHVLDSWQTPIDVGTCDILWPVTKICNKLHESSSQLENLLLKYLNNEEKSHTSIPSLLNDDETSPHRSTKKTSEKTLPTTSRKRFHPSCFRPVHD